MNERRKEGKREGRRKRREGRTDGRREGENLLKERVSRYVAPSLHSHNPDAAAGAVLGMLILHCSHQRYGILRPATSYLWG